ncbi:hypothetical protein CBW58_15105 [Yersinia frederiksenii]|nr:hypothetical protein CBW58_15105 [Yersinia frederiksenii]
MQRVLGHTDIKMTMRYAHFAPDHLEDAVKLNPLAVSGGRNVSNWPLVGHWWPFMSMIHKATY